MKFKLGIIIFLIGFLITLVGAWMKITHITFGPFNGNISLTVGTLVQIAGDYNFNSSNNNEQKKLVFLKKIKFSN